mmetsp:Transcript_49598/g.113584  ORF Transcript_49598/g.113584 Transcript_49598/m.113584 type:complete len:237 (+) Transcript_49598:476-1186(+)
MMGAPRMAAMSGSMRFIHYKLLLNVAARDAIAEYHLNDPKSSNQQRPSCSHTNKVYLKTIMISSYLGPVQQLRPQHSGGDCARCVQDRHLALVRHGVRLADASLHLAGGRLVNDGCAVHRLELLTQLVVRPVRHNRFALAEPARCDHELELLRRHGYVLGGLELEVRLQLDVVVVAKERLLVVVVGGDRFEPQALLRREREFLGRLVRLQGGLGLSRASDRAHARDSYAACRHGHT